MEHYITRWEIPEYCRLNITVASKPLDMAKTFTWRFHSTNHYGQGAKWSWWVTPDGRSTDHSIEVTGEAADLLTNLVYAHDPLKQLVKYFKMPDPDNNQIL
jgi:hypothetical protein